MTANKVRKKRPPLNPATLNELALSYVGRFATTRAKLRIYLTRKIRERGWDEERSPNLQAIADDFARRGYIDDAAYAVSKSRTLTGRGYGARRVVQTLRSAGVEEGDAAGARELARQVSLDAALRFAERKRIGPYASEQADMKGRERALAAMIRAGHDFAVARAIVRMTPGEPLDIDKIRETTGLMEN